MLILSCSSLEIDLDVALRPEILDHTAGSRSINDGLRAPILLDKLVELLPHIRYKMKLDDLGSDISTASIYRGEVLEENRLCLMGVSIMEEGYRHHGTNIFLSTAGMFRDGGKAASVDISVETISFVGKQPIWVKPIVVSA